MLTTVQRMVMEHKIKGTNMAFCTYHKTADPNHFIWDFYTIDKEDIQGQKNHFRTCPICQETTCVDAFQDHLEAHGKLYQETFLNELRQDRLANPFEQSNHSPKFHKRWYIDTWTEINAPL